MKMYRFLAALLLACTAGLLARPAFAHGFGQTYTLPVPLSYFLIGAAATVALSFVVVGFFVQSGQATQSYPTYNLLRLGWFRRTLASPIFIWFLGACSIFLFLLLFVAAFGGTNRPIENISPTFVWIIWWVGMGYVCALLGNAWGLVNPWKVSYEWLEQVFARKPKRGKEKKRGQARFVMRYPANWDVWPAVALFLLFAWLENVYSGAAVPQKLGILVLIYTLITWGGMYLFGKHVWLTRGEAFSVLFSLFGRFSPTEARVKDTSACRSCEVECSPTAEGCVDCYACYERAAPEQREFNLRPFAVGLARPGRISTAMLVFVVLTLATVTFDGLNETSAWNSVQRFFQDRMGAGVASVVDTVGLLAVPTGFLAVYFGFSWLMKRLSGTDASVAELARVFVFSLVPIALAYNVAHYISLLAVQGQLLIPLSSDPFGYGWDLFGSASYRVNLLVINAKFLWFTSIAVIVLGHIIAVYLAHLVSLRQMQGHSQALRSQYPMLLLMVGYTATSLWIIAQPIVVAATE
jgi:hypothetical protein